MNISDMNNNKKRVKHSSDNHKKHKKHKKQKKKEEEEENEGVERGSGKRKHHHSSSNNHKKHKKQKKEEENKVKLKASDIIPDSYVKSYQKDALDFIKSREEEAKNKNEPISGTFLNIGMGGGKTFICLYKIMTAILENPNSKHLIVCEKMLIKTWIDEIKVHFKHPRISEIFRVLIFHSEYYPDSYNKKSYQKFLQTVSIKTFEKNYNVLITTYDVVFASSYITGSNKRVFAYDGNKRIGFTLDEIKNLETNPEAKGYGLITDYVFDNIIIDESHVLRNANHKKKENSKAIALLSLAGRNRIAMTGTPIANRISDAFPSLFFCVLPDDITSPQQFNKPEVAAYLKQYYFQLTNTQLAILNPLPELNIINRKIELSDDEHILYVLYLEALVQQLLPESIDFNKQINNNFGKTLALFTRLRQICISGYLISEDCKNFCQEINKTLNSNKKKSKNHSKSNDSGDSDDEDIEETTEKAEQESKDEREINFIETIQQKYGKKIQDRKGSLGVRSTKFKCIMRLLTKIHNSKEDDQIVAFSYFTSVLKMAADELSENKIPFAYIDGQTASRLRDERIDIFKEKKVKILLINARIGSLGLNLQNANHVVSFEPWYSPLIEKQEIARVLRSGQERPVTYYRFIAGDTIEEVILKMCLSKDQLSDQFSDPENIDKFVKIPRLDKDTLTVMIRNAFDSAKNNLSQQNPTIATFLQESGYII